MKAPASDAESSATEQPAQVRASNGLLVAADELGDFERRHAAGSATRRIVRTDYSLMLPVFTTLAIGTHIRRSFPARLAWTSPAFQSQPENRSMG